MGKRPENWSRLGWRRGKNGTTNKHHRKSAALGKGKGRKKCVPTVALGTNTRRKRKSLTDRPTEKGARGKEGSLRSNGVCSKPQSVPRRGEKHDDHNRLGKTWAWGKKKLSQY